MTIAACALAVSLPASATGAIFGDTNVTNPTLKVDSKGIALVEYSTEAGLRRHVLVWGAINGSAHQTDQESTQARFRMDYSGGWKSRQNPTYWRALRNGCRRYDGPPVAVLRRRLQGV